jgi:HEAT repeat protein
VTLVEALVVIAVMQSVFLVLIVLLLVFNRERRTRFVREREAAQRMVREPVQRWLVGTGDVGEVAAALRTLDRGMALVQTVHLATNVVPATQVEELSAALRNEPWVVATLARARSRRWWRRLEAARLLGVIGGPGDHALLRALLRDQHPAVQSVAAASLPRVTDYDSVAYTLDVLPERALAVRLYQSSMLRDTHWHTQPALLQRLRPDAAPRDLEVWIALAETIGSFRLLQRVLELHDHPEPSVRIAVARALRKFYHPGTPPVLRLMLADDDWRVRAQAARGLATLVDAASVEPLERAMVDRHWWVRFRAALALAQLGERGRAALRRARMGPDRYASEMAAMVSGLSSGSIVELSEG